MCLHTWKNRLSDLLWCTQACLSFLWLKQQVSSACQHYLMPSGKADHQASMFSALCKGSLPQNYSTCCPSWMSWWCNVQERCRLIFVLCLGETLTDAEATIFPPPSAPQISGSLQNHIENKSLFVYGVSGSLRFVFFPSANTGSART